MYDLVVVGGGTSGVATAISAAKQGLKVLIVEKNTFLGGAMTGSLVMPMMKNALKTGENLSSDFVNELMQILATEKNSITFSDGNNGWFNSEQLKITLDELCEKYKIDVFFDTVLSSVNVKKKQINSIEVLYAGKKITINAKYFVDATGNGDFADFLKLKYENGQNDINQAMTLRFIMANVNIKKLATFLRAIDKNENVSPIYKVNDEIHLSTACTWDNGDWALSPIFKQAVKDDVLSEEDCAYFQIFTIPNQPTSIAFNAPRIYSTKSLNPLNVKDTSYALMQGRKQIKRLARFVKKYLPGFENAYISQIASALGIRDSRRILGKYYFNEEDIYKAKKFENAIAKSNYPIDVHSLIKNKNVLNKLEKDDYFEIPIEALEVNEYNNFFIVGKIISASFLAQAALRIIPNCLSMGENLGKYIAQKLK